MHLKIIILFYLAVSGTQIPAGAQQRNGEYRFENTTGRLNIITIRGDSILVLQQQLAQRPGERLQFELSAGTWRLLNNGQCGAFLTVLVCDTCAGYHTPDSIARNNPEFEEWITGPPDTTIYNGDTSISQPSLILVKDYVTANRYRELIFRFTRKGHLYMNGCLYRRYTTTGRQPRRMH